MEVCLSLVLLIGKVVILLVFFLARKWVKDSVLDGVCVTVVHEST